MTTPTVIRVSGTAFSLNPALSTPYPQPSDCANTYRRPDGSILAWDVVYGVSFSSEARTCHPPEVTEWWFQTESTATYTAFGPTFECPEQYEAVQTAVVSADDEGDVQWVFCCPPSFSLHVAQQLTIGWPSQCISTATSGDVLSFLAVSNPDDKSSSSKMTTSTVDNDKVTIWGQPVNGFNLAAATLESESDADGDSDGNNGTPLAVSVGVSVGVVVGAALIALAAWLLWRRTQAREVKPGLESQDDGDMQEREVKPPQELPGDRAGSELQGDGGLHEFPGDGGWHELPAHKDGTSPVHNNRDCTRG